MGKSLIPLPDNCPSLQKSKTPIRIVAVNEIRVLADFIALLQAEVSWRSDFESWEEKA